MLEMLVNARKASTDSVFYDYVHTAFIKVCFVILEAGMTYGGYAFTQRPNMDHVTR